MHLLADLLKCFEFEILLLRHKIRHLFVVELAVLAQLHFVQFLDKNAPIIFRHLTEDIVDQVNQEKLDVGLGKTRPILKQLNAVVSKLHR